MKILSILVLLMICHVSKEAYIKLEQIKWIQKVNEDFFNYQLEIYENKTTSRIEVRTFTLKKPLNNIFVSKFVITKIN